MCNSDKETMDHLVLHCRVAREFCDFLLSLVGMSWMRPSRVMDLLISWTGLIAKKEHSKIWVAILSCLM